MLVRSRRSARSRSGSRTTRAPSTRAAELAVELLDEALPKPVFAPQSGEPTYAAKIEPADRELDLASGGEPEPCPRLSPHIGARGELHGRRVRCGARGSTAASSSRSRSSPRAGSACATRTGSGGCDERRHLGALLRRGR